MKKYDRHYFADHRAGAHASAQSMVPHIVQLMRPGSVVDIGCGLGAWLSVFGEHGVSELLGVDGDDVPRSQLMIPPAAAETFVETLSRLAPVVVFSAAIPMQGGTGHVNEQWQTYWARLFSARGFVAADVLRPVFWDDQRVDWWYRQNTIVYAQQDRLGEYPALGEARGRTSNRMLDVVHPSLLAKRNRKPMRPLPPATVMQSWIRAGRRAVRGT
jgi:hypothetical protein